MRKLRIRNILRSFGDEMLHSQGIKSHCEMEPAMVKYKVTLI